ncbi:MAG: helix-hairpin-helix domain-containing protein [Eggerthellaceae bacterium]
MRELKEGSRVQDAVEAAGGFAENAAPDALNLARVVADGEQVIVPTIEQQEASAAGAAASEASASSGGLVNINAATAAELDALPGIGPATAEKIVADREANGPFSAIEDIKRVSGIGEKKQPTWLVRYASVNGPARFSSRKPSRRWRGRLRRRFPIDASAASLPRRWMRPSLWGRAQPSRGRGS